ncbi:MAG: hypothetical protein M1820_008070 [Bogoriella megaspora]|nr:MAG: hypothetical protein M1820_008070 [Bogoriella megaspora]
MIVDEGGMGIETTGDVAYALPGVAEKGFMDVILTIETAGGHSSRPPKHTAIGIMAEMIQQLEAHPFSPVLSESNPFRGLLECQVRYTPQAIERWLEKALMKGGSGRDIGPRLVEERGDSVRYLMQTSQAVDIIDGGAKDNALPESVTALVNYRVAVHQSVSEVERSVTELLYPIAENHALNINDEVDTDESNPASGLFTLSVKDPLSPSPITPTSIEDPIWRLFSATIRQVFESTSHLEDKTVVPVGDIMTGNTDTIHYWDLSDHIYRFTPARTGTRFNAHTVDERVDMDAHIEGIRTYYELIRNFDVSDAV